MGHASQTEPVVAPVLSLAAVVQLLFLLGGCMSAGVTDAGQGDLVATLPAGMTPIALAGNDHFLRVLSAFHDDGGSQQLGLFSIVDGGAWADPLPSNLSWVDYQSELGDPTVARRFDSREDKAYFLGAQGVTVVPFDGSPATWLFKPYVYPDGGLSGTVPALGYDPLEFEVEPDGTVVVKYAHSDLNPDGGMQNLDSCVIGKLSLDGAWQELARVSDTCGFFGFTADVSAIYFSTTASIWRFDRSSHTVSAIASGLADSVFPTDESTVFGLVAGGSSLYFSRVDNRDGGVLERLDTSGGQIQRLMALDAEGPFISAMTANESYVYLMSQLDLRRVSTTGEVTLLAQRGLPGAFGIPGEISRLVPGDTKLFFTSTDVTDAGVVMATVRAVNQ